MYYFSKVHAQSAQNYETTFYIVFDDDNTDHNLTKEILADNNQYKDFAEKKENRRKDIYADYAVYSTEEKVDNSMHNENFEELIANEKAKFVSQSELAMRRKADKSDAKKKKNKNKTSPVVVLLAFLGVIGAGIGGMALGKNLYKPKPIEETALTNVSEDGMIIPLQDAASADSDTLTVTIDRSYSATPMEDLQLKGVIENGEAAITLPEFDRTDFFTHVPGYTWGFSTDPNGKKIQYYGGKTYKFKEDKKLYRILVKYGGGSGTQEDPYIINYYDQLDLIGEEKARGYFKQTEDIWFPDYASHTPIDTINELKSDPDSEVFIYDGCGYKISNLTSPLFGRVSGATIKNVNITNSHISSPEYKDMGLIVCNAYNYTYEKDGKKYTTGDTVIDRCTVIDSSIYTEYVNSLVREDEYYEDEEPTTETIEVIAPDIIEYDEKGHIIEEKKIEKEPTKKAEYCIGAISGVGADIRNCYVCNFYFTNSLDDYILYVGGISGKPANVLNSAVCGFTANGKIFNAGGIAGNCSGSRMYDAKGKETAEYYGGNIQGCAVRYLNFVTEVSCGGIVGEGGSNVKNSAISNSYFLGENFKCGIYDDKGDAVKTGSVGGVIGTDGKAKYGHKISNTVSPDSLDVIGSKINSKFDESVRLAPYYAYFQENIKLVINANTVDTDDPKEIYTGDFMFSTPDIFGETEKGSLAYPSSLDETLTRIAAELAASTTEE